MEQLTALLGDNWVAIASSVVTLVVGFLVGRGYLTRAQVVAFVGVVDEILDALRRPAEESAETLSDLAIGRIEAALGRKLTEDEKAQVRVTALTKSLRDNE